MRILAAFAGATVLLGAPAAASAAVVPGKGMAGVQIGMSPAEIEGVLGDADRAVTRSDDFGRHRVWSYRKRGGLVLTLRRGRDGFELSAISTRGRKERTKSGVGVGTTKRALRRRLRGERCQSFSGYRSCYLGRFRPGRVVTDFTLSRRGRVTQVRVARVID